MAYVVCGAGAVGGVIGGLLHEAGHHVVLVARGDHLAAIRERGLRLASPERARQVPVRAVASPAEVPWGPEDVILLAVKSDATPSALSALAAAAPPETPLVCMQNGVANEPAALRWFAHVYGVCVMMPAAHLEPGAVEQHCAPTPGLLDIGRFPTGVDDRAAALAAAFRSAGFLSEPRPDIMRWKYRKLLLNLGNAVEAVCGRDAGAEELAGLVRREGEAVLGAAGIDPVSEQTDEEQRAGILQEGLIDGRPRAGGSSWQSLARRTGTIESDYLNGEIVMLGRSYGVPTPANELLRRRANQLAAAGAPPASVPATELLARLGGADSYRVA
jgi:2-dehydropantoate 2-reductase